MPGYSYLDRTEQVTLLGVGTRTKDAIGQEVVTDEETTVFCGVQSVTAKEFFEAGEQGLRPEFKLTVYTWEYSGEQEVNFRGRRLVVYRAYQVGKDLLELYVAKREGVQ